MTSRFLQMSHNNRLQICLLGLMIFAFIQVAEATPITDDKPVAVLEFRDISKAFTPDVLRQLSDEARAGALILRGRGYYVITRENMVAVLKDNGIQPCPEEGECEVQTGRSIGARLVISGEMSSVENTFYLMLKLHDVNTAALLSMERVDGSSPKDLINQLKDATILMIRRGLGLSPTGTVPIFMIGKEGPIGTPVPIPDVSEQQFIVSFQSDPAGAIVLLDDSLFCQTTPCSRALPVGSYEVRMEKERHYAASDRIVVSSGREVSLTLKPKFGLLSVYTEPVGVPVEVDRVPAGDRPVRRREVNPGSHEIYISDKCYQRSNRSVNRT